MARDVLIFLAVFAMSVFLIAISILAIYGVSLVLRDSGLARFFESFKAFFVARRLKLRHKGLASYKVARDGESGTVTYTHNNGGCNAFLYRGISRVMGIPYKRAFLGLGTSVLYCPKCEIIVCRINEAGSPDPGEEDKRGPLGIVK